jgi:hypothetical protein
VRQVGVAAALAGGPRQVDGPFPLLLEQLQLQPDGRQRIADLVRESPEQPAQLRQPDLLP